MSAGPHWVSCVTLECWCSWVMTVCPGTAVCDISLSAGPCEHHVMSLLGAGTPESWRALVLLSHDTVCWYSWECVCVPSLCVLVVLLCVCSATMHGSGRVCVYAVSLGVLVLWCACSITVHACSVTVTPECLLHHSACVCWYSWALAASQCLLVLVSEWSVLWCRRLWGDVHFSQPRTHWRNFGESRLKCVHHLFPFFSFLLLPHFF